MRVFKIDNNFVSSNNINKSDPMVKEIMKNANIKDLKKALAVPDFSKFNKKVVDGHDITLIVGPNGSGKTELLKHFGEIFESPVWSKDKAVKIFIYFFTT